MSRGQGTRTHFVPQKGCGGQSRKHHNLKSYFWNTGAHHISPSLYIKKEYRVPSALVTPLFENVNKNKFTKNKIKNYVPWCEFSVRDVDLCQWRLELPTDVNSLPCWLLPHWPSMLPSTALDPNDRWLLYVNDTLGILVDPHWPNMVIIIFGNDVTQDPCSLFTNSKSVM